jgi:spermidine synthase
MVNTLRREFEHVALFYGGGQGVLVASARPLEWSVERARRYSLHPTVGQTLPDGRALETLGGDVLLVDDGLDRFLEDAASAEGVSLDAMVSTDDNLFLEYETPRGNVLPWEAREALVSYLLRYRDPRAIAALARLPEHPERPARERAPAHVGLRR